MSDEFFNGYKFQLYVTDYEAKILDNNINAFRFVYNWAIEQERINFDMYNDGKSDKSFLNNFDLSSLFYKKVHEDQRLLWLNDYNLSSLALAFKDIELAYNNYFKKITNRPGFKSKKSSVKSFKLRNGRFYINHNKVRIPGFPPNYLIPLHFDTGFDKNYKYYRPSVSKDKLGKYWISFSVKENVKHFNYPKTEAIGIDLGVRKTFTVSNGNFYIQPNEKIKKLEKRKSRYQRKVTKDIHRRFIEATRTRTKYDDIPISNRAKKRLYKLNKIYSKITNLKKTFYQQTISDIIKTNPEAVVIEGAFVKDLIKNKKYMSKIISTVSFDYISGAIEHACSKYGIPLIKADKEYPSTQKCSNCGFINNKIGNKKIFICPNCGMKMDRDLNAAINLKNLYNYS